MQRVSIFLSMFDQSIYCKVELLSWGWGGTKLLFYQRNLASSCVSSGTKCSLGKDCGKFAVGQLLSCCALELLMAFKSLLAEEQF